MTTTFASATRRVYLSIFIVFVSFVALIVTAEFGGQAKSAGDVYIILTDKPKGNEAPKAFHLRTLAAVVGSAQAAKDALVYSYSNAATGFSAKLTPEQVTKMSKVPGVHKVIKSQTYQLQNGMKLKK